MHEGSYDIGRDRQEGRCIPEGASKYLASVKDKMIECFDRLIEKDGVIIVDSDTTFIHCFK